MYKFKTDIERFIESVIVASLFQVVIEEDYCACWGGDSSKDRLSELSELVDLMDQLIIDHVREGLRAWHLLRRKIC